jgi:hypothetical protein
MLRRASEAPFLYDRGAFATGETIRSGSNDYRRDPRCIWWRTLTLPILPSRVDTHSPHSAAIATWHPFPRRLERHPKTLYQTTDYNASPRPQASPSIIRASTGSSFSSPTKAFSNKGSGPRHFRSHAHIYERARMARLGWPLECRTASTLPIAFACLLKLRVSGRTCGRTSSIPQTYS